MVHTLRATYRRWLWADICFHLQMTLIEQNDNFWRLSEEEQHITLQQKRSKKKNIVQDSTKKQKKNLLSRKKIN